MQKPSRFLSAVLLTTFLTSCASSPLGHEPSEAEINASAAKSYQEVKSKSKYSTNAEWTAMVQRVAHRIAVASGETGFKWEAVLIESPEINAWCMPGGKIAVYTGIMPVVKNEAALAAVLGHEVAHATRRHGMQRYARAQNESLGLAGLSLLGGVAGQFLCKNTACKLATGLGGVAGAFMITFLDRKFSRGDETEADQYGQVYMARAGYDPAEAPRLWERMSAAMNGKAPPEWLSTHPSDERRRGNLTTWLPQAEAVYQKAPAHFGLGEPVN